MPFLISLQALPVLAQSVGLLLLSNVFMNFAWYGHLKNLATSCAALRLLCARGSLRCGTDGRFFSQGIPAEKALNSCLQDCKVIAVKLSALSKSSYF